MGSISSEEGTEERCGSYSVSADVSDLGSSTDDVEDDDVGVASSSSLFSSFEGGSSTSLTPTFSFPLIGGKVEVVRNEKSHSDLSEIDLMKERFAKLLLGEDMSGGGKGVCTALAISNAITNLSATVFGELWRLEPLAPKKKAMWRREIKWLLSVSDSIVELVPSIQRVPGSVAYEIMESRPRSDLHINLPALKKLDAMLISILDGFQDTEFYYDNRGIVDDDCDKYTSGRSSVRQEEKWWLPSPKVPEKGLSEDSRKRLQQCRDCTNQILKAALAINSNVLAEMAIPAPYIDNLQKSGRECLGDIIYRHITADQFSPDCLLDCLDLSSEYHTLDVANRIEAAAHAWYLKERKKQPDAQRTKRKSWGGKVKGFVADGEKNQFLAQRAETLLCSLRLRFPGLPQTALEMSKIQYNKDVGHAILESYSRVMESLAFNVIARIDDVLFVDDATKRCAEAEALSIYNRAGGFNGMPVRKKMLPSPLSIQHTPYSSPSTLSPHMPSSPTECAAPLNMSGLCAVANNKLEIKPGDFEKLWSYSGNLGSRRIAGDAPERD